jgi:hypothetical protein
MPDPETRSENILQFYVDAWRNYCFSSKVLDGAFAYLNRNFASSVVAKTVNDNQTSRIYETFKLALKIWRDILFNRVKDIVSCSRELVLIFFYS